MEKEDLGFREWLRMLGMEMASKKITKIASKLIKQGGYSEGDHEELIESLACLICIIGIMNSIGELCSAEIVWKANLMKKDPKLFKEVLFEN